MDQNISETISAAVFFNQTKNGNEKIIFDEKFISSEFSLGDELDGSFLIGAQKYYNPFFLRTLSFGHIGLNIVYGLEQSSLGLTYERQKLSDSTTDDNGFSNLISFEYTQTNIASISLLYETYSGKYKIPGPPKKSTEWVGVKLDSRYWQTLQLSFFYGKRKGGKVCLGGVCQELPEFDGLELNLAYFFDYTF